MTSCAATSTHRMVMTSSCRIRSSPLTSRRHVFVDSNTRHSSSQLASTHTPSFYPFRSLGSTISSSTSSASVIALNERAATKEQRLREDLFSSSLVAFTLGFIAAATNYRTEASALRTETKFLSGGGGGGSQKPSANRALLVADSEKAKEDVKKMRQEALWRPYLVSAGAVQGARWTMEDAYAVENGGRFCAVFDGHGGSQVSAMLSERMFDLYLSILASRHWEDTDDFDNNARSKLPSISSHVSAMRGALDEIENEVLKHDDLVYQGSTAVAVVVHVDDKGDRTLISANVGDSRAILSRNSKAIDLTRDHKPSDEREQARIRAFGEEVQWDPYGEVYRVRDLSLSRAIGDRFAKPVVTSESEIQRFALSEDDEFVLLASDGLWDVMTSQEAVDFVRQCIPKNFRSTIATQVAHEALERGSADNVCVLVIWLKGEDQ